MASKPSLRESVSAWLDQLPVHVTLVAAVIVDTLIVATLLLMDQGVIQGSGVRDLVAEDGNSTLQVEEELLPTSESEDALHVVNIILLIVFLIEVVVRLVSNGLVLLRDHWYLFDCSITVTTVSLYVIMAAAGADRTAVYSVGLIIALRLWRIHKIYKDICERERRKTERIMNVHRKARSDAEEQLKEMHVQLEKQQRELATLREQVSQPNVVRSSPAGTPTRQRRTLPDGGTHGGDGPGAGEWQRVSLETVQVELPPHERYRYIHNGSQNGSLPNLTPRGTPHGSMHSLGTPTSTGSRGSRADMGYSPSSDRASSQSYPDLVEQCTQGREGGGSQGRESLDRETPNGYFTASETNGYASGPEYTRPDYNNGSLPPQYRGHDRSSRGHERSGSDYNNTNDPISSGTLFRPRSASKPEIFDFREANGTRNSAEKHVKRASPSITRKSLTPPAFRNYRKKQKNRLLRASRDDSDMCYENASFNGGGGRDGLSREEADEIKRISQVPFDSTTCLSTVGVPMTDL